MAGRPWHKILDLITEAKLKGSELILSFEDSELIGKDFRLIAESLHIVFNPNWIVPIAKIGKIGVKSREVVILLPPGARRDLIEVCHISIPVIGRLILIKKDGS